MKAKQIWNIKEIHNFKKKIKTMTNHIRALLSIPAIAMIIVSVGCGGCGVVKDLKKPVAEKNDISLTQNDTLKSSDNKKVTLQQDDKYIGYPEVKLTRNYMGKDVSFQWNTEHKGGISYSSVWEEVIPDKKYERKNRIFQMSPTVMLFRRFPTEIAKEFDYIDQPELLEFLDTAFQTIKTVDIWKNRPYQDVKPARLTYYHFDAEGMDVIPYKNQDATMKPNEYSLFTDVRSEGNHVIVNYELRSLKTTKVLGFDNTRSSIIGVKHTLRIYDLQGNLKYELKDLPSVDGAVVSPNGQYMMYTFGGEGMATANNPFGTMDRKGWALMRLSDKKVVYSEFTDDGKLSSGKIMFSISLPRVSYSTPSTELDYDYWVFFDDSVNIIYKHNLTNLEREIINHDFLKSESTFSYRNYFQKFNFQQIPVTNN